MFSLKIILLATSLAHPAEYQAIRFWVPYETQFTCEHGEGQVQRNVDDMVEIAKQFLNAESEHITIRSVVTECVLTPPHI